MIHYLDIRDMSRKQWLKYREGGFGGSEVCAAISAVLGDQGSKNSDPIKIHLNKIGEPVTTFSGNRFTKFGKQKEEAIAHNYQFHDHNDPDCEVMLDNEASRKKKFNYVRLQDCYITNDKYPWLFASIDRRILRNKTSANPLARKGRGLLECKNTTSMEKNRYTYGINPDFYYQVYQYLMLTEWDYADVAIEYDGNNFEVITLEPRKEIFEFIEHESVKVWQNILECRKIKIEYDLDTYYGVPDSFFTSKQWDGVEKLMALEPEMRGTESEKKFIREVIVPTEEYTEMEGTQKIWDLAVVERVAINKKKAILDDKLRKVNNRIIRSLSGTHIANFEGGVVSYKPNKVGVSSIHVSEKLFKIKE